MGSFFIPHLLDRFPHEQPCSGCVQLNFSDNFMVLCCIHGHNLMFFGEIWGNIFLYDVGRLVCKIHGTNLENTFLNKFFLWGSNKKMWNQQCDLSSCGANPSVSAGVWTKNLMTWLVISDGWCVYFKCGGLWKSNPLLWHSHAVDPPSRWQHIVVIHTTSSD